MAVERSIKRVPNLEHRNLNIDWNGLRLFILVGQNGSLRSASREAGLSINTVRRRLEQLEHSMGCRLLLRDSNGTHLTESGRKLFSKSRPMFDTYLDVVSDFEDNCLAHSNQLRIAVSNHLGPWWVMCQLAKPQTNRLAVVLDIDCSQIATVQRSQSADLSVQLDVPSDNDLMVVRLGYLHRQLFASQKLIAQKGKPQSVDDLQNFSFVEEVLDPVSDFDPLSMISNETKHLVAMRTHSFSDQCEAVRNGVGLGFLPTFATACADNIVPLLDEIHGRQDIFLTYRRSSGAHRNLRAVINWLKAIFDRRIYPWFSEEFVPAGGFEDLLRRV